MNESVQKCLEYGINYFDTAELYGFGQAEILLGQAFKELKVRREEIVVSTKLFYAPAGLASQAEHFEYYTKMGVNQVGLSRKHVIEGTKASLKRL